MHDLRNTSTVSVLFILLMLTFLFCGARGQGESAGIRYIQTDRTIYEVGQVVNITAAWYIDYGVEELVCSEGAISCLRGESIIGIREWLNEQRGFHIHQGAFSLSPSDWNPCETGENGTARSLLCLPMNDNYQTQQLDTSFRVMRSRQNCSLIDITPCAVVANASAISLFLRCYNANNASFAVGQNNVSYNITNPLGCMTVINNFTTTDTNGSFVIPFNPSYINGDYCISLRSSENEKYLEGCFDYNLTIGRSPIPTQLELNWRYAGDTLNSTDTCALESVEISARLVQTLDKSAISRQQIEFSVIDPSSLKSVFQSRKTTNVSGFASDNFIVPYEGSFVLRASYRGLYGTWSPSLNSSIRPIKASPRELSIAELVGLPSVISLGQEYHGRYLVLDTRTKCPVSNLSITLSTDDLTLANNSTNSDGIVELGIRVPVDRWDLAGNLTLSIGTLSGLARRTYTDSSISRQLLCKIPTVIKLDVYPRDMVQNGETILVCAQLQSFNLTPISAVRVTFAAFLDQKSGTLINVTGMTDAHGLCTFPLRMSASGSLTIVADFGGSSIFDHSSDTLTTSILPEFLVRLSSSIPTTFLVLLLSLILIPFMGKRKRKISWHEVTVP